MNEQKIKKYFAAANSYNGFISYFDDVFPSAEFSRIYVIKGGPGTGKSSLMKAFSKAFSDFGYFIEEIYCSSDPHSLDGVIIETNEKKVALLDGTAPHQRDAKIPGAIDEIINLGDNWDSRWLVSSREKIMSKTRLKGEAYQNAYDYLKIAGLCHTKIQNTHKNKFDVFKAKNKAESIFNKEARKDAYRRSVRLISSFGKLGSYSLSLPTETEYKIISIGGKEYSSALFLDALHSVIKTNAVLYLNALDPTMLDAIELLDEKIIVVRMENGEINANEFVKLSPVEYEYIKTADSIKSQALEEAQRWFAVASNLHFELEDIYKEAMNFQKNDNIFKEKLTEIQNILEN